LKRTRCHGVEFPTRDLRSVNAAAPLKGLHPYTHTEAGLAGIAATCPISGHAAWPIVLTDLGMAAAHAQEWHRLLYAQLRTEQRASPDHRIGCPTPA